MHAVILAGGTGTRLRPYITCVPKPLVPIGDTYSILEIVLHQLRSRGFSSVTLAIERRVEPRHQPGHRNHHGRHRTRDRDGRRRRHAVRRVPQPLAGCDGHPHRDRRSPLSGPGRAGSR